jgi:hypothetical protein
MKLIFSLSNQTAKLTKLELPRIFDENNKNLGVQYFDEKEAWKLSHHLNQQTRKVKMPNGKKQSFIPQERFLDESLYLRYANT